MGSDHKHILAPTTTGAYPSTIDIYVGDQNSEDELLLVSQVAHLSDRESVRRFLPDILGRVLARMWIDSVFHERFARDPKATLEDNRVYLPASVLVEYVKVAHARPRIIVIDQSKNSAEKIRLMSLQLVMVAGK